MLPNNNNVLDIVLCYSIYYLYLHKIEKRKRVKK